MCAVLLPVVFARLRSFVTIVDATVGEGFVGIRTNASTELLARPGTCCGRGSQGRRGICLPGDPNGLCCAAEVTLLCGAGSTCYLNTQGNPYCCAPRTKGCLDVCLDFNSASRVVEEGGSCNRVSPQGFRVDGTVLYVDAPWVARNMTYRLDGSQNITFVDPPIRFGAGDFTMRATITPRVDGRVGQIGFRGDMVLGFLFLRASMRPFTGFAVYFSPPISGSTTATVILGRNVHLDRLPPGIFSPSGTLPPLPTLVPNPNFTLPPSFSFGPGFMISPGLIPIDGTIPFTTPPGFTVPPAQIITVNISGIWQANIPVSFRIIRQGLNISVYVNESRAEVVEEITQALSDPVDVDSGLEAPLLISPRVVDDIEDRADLDASIARMSMSSSADFP